MPTLPSGRRIEFSLDRFTVLLEQLTPQAATDICAALIEPDDLMHVLDIVLFQPGNGEPYFAGFVLSQWPNLAAAWDENDREYFRRYLDTTGSQAARAEAIATLRATVLGRPAPQPRGARNAAPETTRQKDLLQAA